MPQHTGPFPNAVDESGRTLLFLDKPVPTWPPLTHLPPAEIAAGITVANRTGHDLSSCGQGPRHLACLCFDLAAAEALGKYDHEAGNYNGNTEGQVLAQLAARLAAVCRAKHHPHILTCQALKVVSLAAVGHDTAFAQQWLDEKSILNGIPKGSLTGPVENHFLQAAHLTIRDLARLPPADDAPAPTAVEHQIASKLNHMGAHGRKGDYNEVIGLLGIYGWVKAVNLSKATNDVQEFSAMFKAATELLQDIYMSPALGWVRTAYAMRITERQDGS